MASSRLGPSGVSGLASSLRSAASASSNNNSNNNNNNTPNNGYYNHNINNDNNNNNGGHGSMRGHYQQRGTDATVPGSDDSTEEDEEYNSYIQEQEMQHRLDQQQRKQHDGGNNMNFRQQLHEDDDQDHGQHSDNDHGHQQGYFQRHHHDQHGQNDMDLDDNTNGQLLQARQNEILEDGDEDFDDDDDDDDDEDMDDDDRSETLSLTEDDIDFNLVYAFHTFVATQEGQASVVRNDSLMLLEDTNVYWWLVRVLNTGVIGYIPAENIETPFERLARLNKYRNVGLSAPAPEWGTFDEPIRALDGSVPGDRSANRRSVIFASQNIYFGASDNEWDDEDEDEDEDDEMGEYYEGNDEDEGSETHGDDGSEHDHDGRSGKTAIQLEAERVEQEILDEQRQQQRVRRNEYGTEESEQEDEDEDEEQVTNRYRRPLLDEDDLVFSDEPRKISLTPSIAQDDVSVGRIQAPLGKAKKLRLADEESLNTGRPTINTSSTQQQQQNQQSAMQAPGEHHGPSLDTEEDERQRNQRLLQEKTEAKLAALLGEKEQGSGAETGLPSESIKKPGKFKSLFGVGKGSKDKEKERKEKERLEKERLKTTMAKGPSVSGASATTGTSSSDASRARSSSNGSLGSFNGSTSALNTPLSPSSVAENGDGSQEIIALRVYPGNVDFGASMYKTVVVSPFTMASEVANQAVVKFRLAPDGVASTTDFFLTVRGVDGDETVLQPTDKIMAIYQSLTAHLTTPLPLNHRLSISSVSSMLSMNSTSSYNSNPPTPTSPNSVRRIGSGKSDPHQRSIRFLLNKKIRRTGSMSSVPGTPTTPTTPTTPLHDDTFWVKVICLEQDLPQTMLVIDGMGTAMDKSDTRVQGQITASKVEHWIPMHSTSNAGDVIFNTLAKIDIRTGVVEGISEGALTAKRNSIQSGVVIEYQLGLRLNGQTSRRAKQGEELLLAPQTPLIRCFDDHQLTPVRRSPKADIASMPLSPDHVFYLRKSPKSIQAEKEFTEQRLQQQQQNQSSRKMPAPLQSESLRSSANDSLKSPTEVASPTSLSSPRSLRTLRTLEDVNGPESSRNGPASPGFRAGQQLSQGGRNVSGAGSPSQMGDVNVRIPRRTDSSAMGPTSPVQSHHSSRTPTPDHSGMGHPTGRNRSPSISQGIRPGQSPSPAPSGMSHRTGTEQDGSRSSTPERPTRPERPERPERQRAISPSMTHGRSPLSMSAVLAQENGQGHMTNMENSREQGLNGRSMSTSSTSENSKIAPQLNVKKNAAQGTDIILNKGVIRSSRLMHSKQYRYSFIPLEGGDEVDISEIIEDILGEDDDEDEDEDLQHLDVGDDDMSDSRYNRPSNGGRGNSSAEKDRLRQITSSGRGNDTLMKLEKSLAADFRTDENPSTVTSRTASPSPMQSRPVNATTLNQNRALASPLSLSSSSLSRNSKRDSDVEIQVASVASITTRSASPVPSARTYTRTPDSGPGSPRTLRPASPYGMMAKPTLLSSPNTANRATTSSPLKESSSGSINSPQETGRSSPMIQDASASRSFSPIPRRLQTPSPAPKQNINNTGNTSNSSSPNLRPSSPSAAGSGGRASPVGTRSNSGASVSSVSSARSRSASASVAENSRLSPQFGSTSSTTSSSSDSGKEWLLSSDYNAGMQDLLTLVRAGRSSSVSSPSNSSMLLRGAGGMGSPLVGKDGKIVALPSTIKASLLSRSRSPSLSQLQAHLDTQQQKHGYDNNDNQNNTVFNDNENNNMDGTSSRTRTTEETRMMLMMLNELTLKDVQQDCHPDVYECWRDVDADLDRVERELDDLLVTVKASVF